MEMAALTEAPVTHPEAVAMRLARSQILLVEDSSADIRLTREVFDEFGMLECLRLARDGEQAMRMLRREAEYKEARLPDLVLLDLNLPGKDGRQVLREIKLDPRLKRLPVLVLSTSIAEADVQDCYEAGANCYIPKPVDLEDFFALARSLRDFWLGIAHLPFQPQEGKSE